MAGQGRQQVNQGFQQPTEGEGLVVVAHLEARVSVERGTEEVDPDTGKLKAPTGSNIDRWLKWRDMTGKELEALPEGRRKKRNIITISVDEFKLGDIVTPIDGEKFEMVERQVHSNHYRMEAVKC